MVVVWPMLIIASTTVLKRTSPEDSDAMVPTTVFAGIVMLVLAGIGIEKITDPRDAWAGCNSKSKALYSAIGIALLGNHQGHQFVTQKNNVC